jgi:hypothetical protein
MRLHLISALLLCVGSTALAQKRTVISSKPSCPNCRIELVKLFSVGGADDTVAYDQFMQPTAVANKKGQVFITPTVSGSVLVFTEKGQVIKRFGRKGKGPGEFEGLMHIEIGPGDSVHVFDYGGARGSVYSPDLKFIRATQVFGGQRFHHVILPNGDYFMYATPSPQSDSLMTLHSSTGKLIRRYPPVWRRLADPYASIQFDRVLTSAGGRSVWVAHTDRYEIEKWDGDGTVDQILDRQTDWWTKPSSSYPYFPRERKPEPILKALYRAPDGLLWTVIGVSKPDWKQLDRPSATRGERPVMAPSEHMKFFDTIIEVIDPQTGALITSRRFPFVLQSIRTGNIAIGLREDSEGSLARDIYRVELRRN